jgi:hypothetical protein
VSQADLDTAGREELRVEAAPVAALIPLVLVGLAVVSRAAGWEFAEVPWWGWLALAAPAVLLAVDLWLGPRGLGIARTRSAGVVLLVALVVGNLVGSCSSWSRS